MLCISTSLSNLREYVFDTQSKIVQNRIAKVEQSVDIGLSGTKDYVNGVIQDAPLEFGRTLSSIRQAFKIASSVSNTWKKIYNSWKHDLTFDLFFRSSRIIRDIWELDGSLGNLGFGNYAAAYKYDHPNLIPCRTILKGICTRLYSLEKVYDQVDDLLLKDSRILLD